MSSAEMGPTQPDDTVDPSATSTAQEPNYREPVAPRGEGKGELLELADKDPEEAVRRQVKLWDRQNAAMRRRKVFWDRNRLWLKGVRGVRARPASRDFSDWALYVPPGALDIPPLMDRTEELLDRVASHLLVDPPVPDVEPETGEESARDGAEFAQRLLSVEGDPLHANDMLNFRKAIKRSGVFGSAFLYRYVDPQGGGWEPMDVKAHPMAQTMADAEIDPQTGQPADTGSLVTRFVTDDDSLTDDATLAKKRWRPTICTDVLDGRTVRFIPETAKSVREAQGMMVLGFTTMGQLKDRFPEVAKLDADEQRTMVEWIPDAAKWAMPWYVSARFGTSLQFTEQGFPLDDSPVCTLGTYYKASSQYPEGCYFLSAGAKYVLHAEVWAKEVGEGEQKRLELLRLPFSQIRQINDDDADDPYGKGLVEFLGPAGEVSGTIVIGMLDYLDRFLHPLQYLPLGSEVQPEAMAARDGTPIFVTPGMEAFTEQVPPFPTDLKEFFQYARESQDSTVGLYAPAQGNTSASIRSGAHASIEVQQSNINLTGIKDNLADGIVEYWAIGLQLYRAFFTQPMLLQYLGRDNAYKEKAWTGLDLMAAKNVRIQVGSFTMRSPEAKLQMIQQWSTPVAPNMPPLLEASQAKAMLTGNIRPIIGLQDDPNLLRIRRQLDAFADGPPQGWEEQAQQFDMAQQQAQQMQQQAEQAGQPFQPPQIPPLFTPFERLPVDLMPTVAHLRAKELGDEMAGTKFGDQPPRWRQTLTDEFEQMRQAAGIATTQETNQANQQQAQAQQQVELAKAIKPAEIKAQADLQKAQMDSSAQTERDLLLRQRDSDDKANEPPEIEEPKEPTAPAMPPVINLTTVMPPAGKRTRIVPDGDGFIAETTPIDLAGVGAE